MPRPTYENGLTWISQSKQNDSVHNVLRTPVHTEGAYDMCPEQI